MTLCSLHLKEDWFTKWLLLVFTASFFSFLLGQVCKSYVANWKEEGSSVICSHFDIFSSAVQLICRPLNPWWISLDSFWAVYLAPYISSTCENGWWSKSKSASIHGTNISPFTSQTFSPIQTSTIWGRSWRLVYTNNGPACHDLIQRLTLHMPLSFTLRFRIFAAFASGFKSFTLMTSEDGH